MEMTFIGARENNFDGQDIRILIANDKSVRAFCNFIHDIDGGYSYIHIKLSEGNEFLLSRALYNRLGESETRLCISDIEKKNILYIDSLDPGVFVIKHLQNGSSIVLGKIRYGIFKPFKSYDSQIGRSRYTGPTDDEISLVNMFITAAKEFERRRKKYEGI